MARIRFSNGEDLYVADEDLGKTVDRMVRDGVASFQVSGEGRAYVLSSQVLYIDDENPPAWGPRA